MTSRLIPWVITRKAILMLPKTFLTVCLPSLDGSDRPLSGGWSTQVPYVITPGAVLRNRFFAGAAFPHHPRSRTDLEGNRVQRLVRIRQHLNAHPDQKATCAVLHCGPSSPRSRSHELLAPCREALLLSMTRPRYLVSDYPRSVPSLTSHRCK